MLLDPSELMDVTVIGGCQCFFKTENEHGLWEGAEDLARTEGSWRGLPSVKGASDDAQWTLMVIWALGTLIEEAMKLHGGLPRL